MDVASRQTEDVITAEPDRNDIIGANIYSPLMMDQLKTFFHIKMSDCGKLHINVNVQYIHLNWA